MVLLRLLLIGALLFAAWLLLQRWLRHLKVGVDKLDRTQNVPTVRCAHCGLFLPKSQAWTERDRYFCCQAHLKAGPEDRS